MKTISGKVPYGRGGMGQHLAQVIEEARAEGALARYYAAAVPPEDEFAGVGVVVKPRLTRPLLRYTPIRFSKAWRDFVAGGLFDRAVAARLAPPVPVFVGVAGQALHSFRRARALGADRLELHVATRHVRAVERQHAAAARRYGIEGGWLNRAHLRQALAEYERADVICVNSEYVRESFLAEGVPEAKLQRFHLQVHPRFRPAPTRPDDGVFRVVYVGSLTEVKGVPVLLEAFAEFPDPAAELVLVGETVSRAMGRYLQGWLRREPRLRLASGDALPHLQRADVYVHPSYQDGYGYAPMEALACGVPVVVTEDTGMKEHVREGENGFVVPTGDPSAILERLVHLRAHPLPAFALAVEDALGPA